VGDFMNDDTRIFRGVGLLTARVILGLIFGMAGYWKVFELTPVGHAQKLFIGPYANTWIPVWMLWATGTVIPVVELVAGWLLVVGWRVREALMALAVVLMTVTYGHLLLEPLYNFNGHVIPRTVLLLVLALTPRSYDVLCVDAWLSRRARRPF
jgi:putative oxidoreductase